MTQSLFGRYPVGIQTFSEIRKNNLLYIDKTEYVYRMTHSGKYMFKPSAPIRKIIACKYPTCLFRGTKRTI